MSDLQSIEKSIEGLLALPPYESTPEEHETRLLELLKNELAYACQLDPHFRHYVEQWPVKFKGAAKVADLPYLPVTTFKANPPFALVTTDKVTRILTSSATTSQTPSRISLDGATARRMTKGVVALIKDFIGPTRRPYLIIDTPENIESQSQMTARGAAVQSLRSFASDITTCLVKHERGECCLDLQALLDFADKCRAHQVLVYGFTHMVWTYLIQPLRDRGLTLGMRNAHLLHSGGWKRLQQIAVTKEVFNREVAAVIGCSESCVIDFYGMVENVGVVYPDCEFGNKHVPTFADVIVRSPLTLAPVRAGEQGLVEVCSVLPTSFPGFLLLTEDMAEVVGYDGCRCGRRGMHFRFTQRVPNAEVRGCGNLESDRRPYRTESSYA